MSYFEKFCPECGQRLEGAKICPKCGFEIPEETPTTAEEASKSVTKKATKKATKKSTPRSGDDSTWKSLENIISFVGKFSWIILAIIAIWLIIGAIINFLGDIIGWGIVQLVGVAIMAYLVWTYGKIYSQKCKEKDWSFLVNDVLVIGSFQMPKMLAYGIVVAFITYGTGVILIVLPALLIIFAGPEEFSWKV